MDYRGQRADGSAPAEGSGLGIEKKTSGLIENFDSLFDQTRPAFAQERTFLRARTLALSALVGLGRRTVSGMLCTSAQQFSDWSAAYRLFERERFGREALFAPVRREVTQQGGPQQPLVVMMDDTLVRKRGRKVSGTGWRRDPLGPHFRSNFVWGQRFLQISAALPDQREAGRARGVPIDLVHAPSPRKPRKTASEQEWESYRQQQQATKVSRVGAARIAELRHCLDSDPQGHDRRLIVSVDGGFTNRTVFREIPHKTVLIGRIRKDARLFQPPSSSEQARRGRPRYYGDPMPTPEQIRQNASIPWQSVEAFGGGKRHVFQVKSVPAVRWHGTGSRDVRLVVIRPLAYRPQKGSRLLYRQPGYLLCTDPQLPLPQLLQAYVWRWEVEVNFREQKTLLGVGEAQVRTPVAAEMVPTLITAAYSFLLLAAHKTQGRSTALPPPKWRRDKGHQRCSTASLLGFFRAQLWGKAMGVNLKQFAEANIHIFNNGNGSQKCMGTLNISIIKKRPFLNQVVNG